MKKAAETLEASGEEYTGDEQCAMSTRDCRRFHELGSTKG